MRTTSFIKQLGILALFVSLGVSGLPVLAATTAHPAPTRASSFAAGWQRVIGDQAQGFARMNRQAPPSNFKVPDEVLQAGILPDPENLLPVAAIVGFSFLFGGIVSAIKTRP
jgi:hypothetical protein